MSLSGPASLASLDGVIMPAAEATIPATDDGLIRGDGAFEVIRIHDGVPYALDAHLARLRRSGENLRLPIDLEAIRADAHRLLAEAARDPDTAEDHAQLRIVVTRGGRRLLLTEPVHALPETARLMSITYAPTRLLDGIKSLSYGANMLAGRLAREAGYDEALLVTPHGRVLEAPTSSVFWVIDGRLCTTPLSEHVLASITRALILDVVEAEEDVVTLDELAAADEVFLASTVREVHPVSALDAVTYPAQRPITDRTAAAVRERIRAELALRVLTVIGNRPQFVKAAAVSPILRREHAEVLVHTGQHFDDRLSAIFFAELGIPAPDRELHVGGGSATSQTARMLAALEPVLTDAGPDVVLVYGDTNSTLAGALAGAQAGVPVAHVEAGMRSWDTTMPEELNRVLTDHAASLLLCSTASAADNLRAERVSGQVKVVGDVMVDLALKVAPAARDRTDLLAGRGLEPGGYVLATAHRAGNVDDPARLRALVEMLEAVGAELPVVLPLHPRTRARLDAAGLGDRLARAQGMRLTEPLGYLELTALLGHARAVLTDSGGLQKEAYLASVPCLTLRDRTEWTETVQTGWNTLVDLDATAALVALRRPTPTAHPPLYGDGQAGERVVAALRLLAR